MYRVTRSLATVLLQRAAVVVGFAFLLGSKLTPLAGPPAPEVEEAKPEILPWDSTLTTQRRKATLVLVLDAGAPSAEVSISELRQTLAGREDMVTAHVVFVVREDEFVERELWGRAASIPGVHVLRDAGGVEAGRLAATVGTAVLYRADRRLLYRGASMQELPALLDQPTTDGIAPPRRRDAAQRRPGPLDDWIDPDSSRGATL